MSARSRFHEPSLTGASPPAELRGCSSGIALLDARPCWVAAARGCQRCHSSPVQPAAACTEGKQAVKQGAAFPAPELPVGSLAAALHRESWSSHPSPVSALCARGRWGHSVCRGEFVFVCVVMTSLPWIRRDSCSWFVFCSPCTRNLLHGSAFPCPQLEWGSP